MLRKVVCRLAYLDILLKAIEEKDSVVTAVPVDYDIAVSTQQVSRSVVPDMPDRIITATALHLKLPLVTRDHKIQAAQVITIW